MNVEDGQEKPRLSLARILQMNVGFLGLQFSFGLQQSNMTPIYSYLGADEAVLPLLSLAGPVTGLIVQPLIGALSDRTTGRFGRRTPYFLVGAGLCGVCLLAMPYSPALWVAASLLWILDAANNVTMEPYRAYVSDRLDAAQRPMGFLTQSAFTGLAQTLAYLAPSLLVLLGVSRDAVDANHIPAVTRIAFVTGSVLSVVTVLWSVRGVPELPLSPAQVAAIRRRPGSWAAIVRDILGAVAQMPAPMRQLALAMMFQWYAMFCYWQYIAFAIGRSLFHANTADGRGFRDAVLVSGQIGGVYNGVAFVAAFAMAPFARRLGVGRVHAACLSACGLAMLALPGMNDRAWLFAPMLGIGVGWASMMGNPYVMLADSIPPERTGVYMGIFNMFIVIPMLIEGLTLPLIYHPLLGGDPRRVLTLAGGLMIAAAGATLLVRTPRPAPAPASAILA